MNEAGIPTAVHYPIPLNLQPAVSDLRQGEGRFPVAEREAMWVMSLPMGPDLDFSNQQFFVDLKKKI